jgi:hypothetical protein
MAGIWTDAFGTLQSFFRLGLSGPRLKANGSNLVVRNGGDTADATVTASSHSSSGDVGLIINSDAAATGADWSITIQRPSTGMTASYTLTLPVDDGTPNQVLSTDGAGVLSWASSASTASSAKVDSTSLAFGSTSPVTMFTTGASDIINEVRIIVDTAFNGTPTVSVGISGTTSKYMASTQNDLTATATTTFAVHPGLTAQGAEAIIATYAAGGASAGAARIEVEYYTPS